PANNDKRSIQALTLPEISLKGTVKEYPFLKITLLNTRREYKLWNRIVFTVQFITAQGLRFLIVKFAAVD
ncbi:MAG: hypothetical protein KKF54_01010, partial [Candidatus Omnitrophica bacterium]|nr:hypothetical protein [Candidatus Omnitrophota bacterium]